MGIQDDALRWRRNQRLDAILVACGNDQVFGVHFEVTFAAVIDMSSVKTVFAGARK